MELFGLSRSQIALWSLALGLTLVLGTAAADAMVETDTERLEEVGRVLARESAGGRVDGLLAWAAPSREPVYVSAGRAHWRVDDDAELPDVLHEALAPLDDGRDVEVVQDEVSVRGETGTVAVATRVDGERVDVTLTLRREGQGWLLSGVRAF